MDREVRFRGRRKNGEWIYGDLIHFSPENKESCMIIPKGLILHSPYTNPYTVKYNTVGQYTNRNDKHGVEIYEDDIVKTNRGIGVVRYNAHQWFYEVAEIDEPITNKRVPGGIPEEDWEVLGNIHDNPELLKQK